MDIIFKGKCSGGQRTSSTSQLSLLQQYHLPFTPKIIFINQTPHPIFQQRLYLPVWPRYISNELLRIDKRAWNESPTGQSYRFANDRGVFPPSVFSPSPSEYSTLLTDTAMWRGNHPCLQATSQLPGYIWSNSAITSNDVLFAHAQCVGRQPKLS